MFKITSFNRHREGAKRKSPSFRFLILIPLIAIGLLAYSSGPLVRVKANCGARGGSERANIFKSIAAKPGAAPATPTAELINATFYVHSYGGKCLSFGAPLQVVVGTPPQASNSSVYIYDCNSTRPLPQQVSVGAAQQVRVVELPAVEDRRNGGRRPREVQLRAGDKCIGAAGNFMVPGVPLVLQNCNGSAGQTFALDGDSIIFARDRDLVVEVKNARGQNGTPLVVGERDLDDSEFWSFTATDGSGARPTSGFVRASNAWEFLRYLFEAKWGTVIEVDSERPIELLLTANIPAGVTIRGDRRGLTQGAEFHWPDLTEGPMFAIEGDHVRITGLRFRGPSRSTDRDLQVAHGILAKDKFFSIIDHNELSEATAARMS